MELSPGILADGAALFLEKSRTLVLADLHLGYEEAQRTSGVLLLATQEKDMLKEFDRLFVNHHPTRVVLAGDVKHEFGRISSQEWSGVQRFIEHIQKKGCEVSVVVGNHDKLLLPIIDKMHLEHARACILETDILVVHGDETMERLIALGVLKMEQLKSIKTVLMGHEHPALRISDGIREETVKYFLVGKGLGKRNVIVLPSCNPLTFGTDVLRERPLGPLLATYDGFSAFAIVDERILEFGAVKRLRTVMR
jgi:putative SbcD/Mre11-related phosphoesterase